MATISKVYTNEGLTGFYRGWMSPFLGGTIFRSAQFTAYEAFYTKAEDHEPLKRKIPGSNLQYRVPLGGILSGTARAVVETPFEYAKVKR